MPSPRGKRYTDNIMAILYDGKSHPEYEIAIRLMDVVAPEHASKRSEHRRQGGNVPLQLRVQTGMSVIARTSLRWLQERGKVTCERINGKRYWRLAGEAAEWAEAMTKHGIPQQTGAN